MNREYIALSYSEDSNPFLIKYYWDGDTLMFELGRDDSIKEIWKSRSNKLDIELSRDTVSGYKTIWNPTEVAKYLMTLELLK